MLPLLLTLSVAQASDDKEARESLRGIDTVKVVCDLSRRTELLGITCQQIVTDVELQLRKAGIKVDSTKAGPFLYVNLNAQDSGKGTYAVALELSFEQLVRLDRAPTTKNMVPTWGIFPVVLTASHERYSEFCRQEIRDLADQFANAYLSVNPK